MKKSKLLFIIPLKIYEKFSTVELIFDFPGYLEVHEEVFVDGGWWLNVNLALGFSQTIFAQNCLTPHITLKDFSYCSIVKVLLDIRGNLTSAKHFPEFDNYNRRKVVAPSELVNCFVL